MKTSRAIKALAVSGLMAAMAVQPQASLAQSAGQVINVDFDASQGGVYSLPKGRSADITLSSPAGSVVAADKTIVNVVPLTNSRFNLLGLKPGRTTVSFNSTSGRLLYTADIEVQSDVDGAKAVLAATIPNFRGNVMPLGEGFALTGAAASADEAKGAEEVLRAFAGKDAPIYNRLAINGPQMVTIKAQIVEVQRSVIKQLGFDTSAILGQLGSPQYSLLNSATFGVNGSLLGGVTGGYRVDTTSQPLATAPDFCGSSTTISEVNKANCVGVGRAGSTGLNSASALVKAFERNGLFRTIAEPSVTTSTGEVGAINSGGKFPVPTGRDSSGQVTIEFKEYGIQLKVVPVIVSEDNIQLKIHTEVSELSSNGGLTIAGLSIPGLTGNNSDSVVSLPSGGAIMSSSLLKQVSKQDIGSLPGLGQMPGPVGTLLRSRDYLQGDTELVVIITATLASPTDPSRLQTPADGLRVANDIETVLLGQLNRPLRQPAGSVPRPYQGPIGYVIE